MIQPTEPGLRVAASVRNGQLVAVTCAACGCRLGATELGRGARWRHFGAFGGRDAIGCRVACLEALHDVAGRAI
jgi:hypothetical protein